MNAFLMLCCIIFAVFCVVHAARLFYRWPVRVGTADIPLSASWFAVVVSGVLAIWAWQLTV
jgi:hypothetical protein